MKIQHDFHIHTSLSRCAKRDATFDGYLERGKQMGLAKMGFSDHFWDSAISGANGFYQPQDYNHVEQLKPEIEKHKNEGIELFFGCETEYDPFHHGVAITEETAEKFDFIIVPNSHTHMMMPKDFYEPYEKHVDFMINAYEEIINSSVSRYITAMAHPFEAVACPYDNSILIDMISDDKFKELFDKTAEKNIAVEINIASFKGKSHSEIESNSKLRIFRLAKECGCKFLFGSDAHEHSAYDYFWNADFVADLLELTDKDIADIAII